MIKGLILAASLCGMGGMTQNPDPVENSESDAASNHALCCGKGNGVISLCASRGDGKTENSGEEGASSSQSGSKQ